MTRKQTLVGAVRDREIRIALNGIVGCPVGGWGETRQAVDRLRDAIPIRQYRAYTIAELIDHALCLDHADRYQWRVESK